MTGGMAGGGGGMGGGYDGGAHMAGGGGGGGGFAGGAGMGGGYAGGAHMAGGSVGDAHMSGGAHMGGAGMGGGYVGGAHMAGGSHMGCAGPMAATGCMDGGCATGCMGEVTTSGSLTYVGASRGDWVTETTYKYVGVGAGDLAVMVTNKRSYLPCAIIGVLLLASVVAVALLCLQTPTTTAPVIVKDRFISTTRAPVMPPPPPPPQRKTCLFWGDPHLVTFDGARPSFYGDGEYWIVNSGPVQIQGRYMGTKYTYGLAATQKVVVAGTFLNGHKIEVEPVERAYGGRILVDGQPVLAEFGILKVCEGATITYDGQGELPDKAASLWTSRIVHMELPMGISFTVYRWGNYLDLKLEMTPVPGGQDGSCGNFNGDPADDTTTAILARGARVTDNDLLFSSRAVTAFTTEEAEMLRRHCPAEELVKGELACRKDLPQNAETVQVNACVFDFCFGMNEHALQTAKNYATPEDKKAANM